MTEKGCLARAYEVKTLEETGKLYDDWADSYDADVGGFGYLTPQRCTDALAAFSPDRRAPVLDLGCGTGRGAHHLKLAGFEVVDGADYSDGMLKVARDTGYYRALAQCDLNDPLPPQLTAAQGFTGPYARAAVVGVLQPNYVKGAALGQILDFMTPDGVLVFSLNDHSLETGVFQGAAADLAAAGRVETLFDVYGEHLPATGLRARVFALRKTG